MATPLPELPDGRLVCTQHQLTICGSCCVDYSFMDEIIEESKEEAASSGENDSTQTKKPKKQTKKSKNTFSRNKMVKEHWGDRQTFQASYGLKMSPDDIAEGTEILRAMERADKQAHFHERG